jgi:V8-like Glu-specific endopeptidase
MRITNEKNLAFAGQPKPLTRQQVEQRIKVQKPARTLEPTVTDFRLLAPSLGKPQLEIIEDKQKRQATIRLHNFVPGKYVFHQGMKHKQVKPLGNKSRVFCRPLTARHFRPEHLGLSALPKPAPKKLAHVSLRSLPDLVKRGDKATTIFPPDDRYIFQDKNYPWCCCGRVDSPNGQGSGVMVGPRHLLTVSHVIQWNDDDTAGWVKFSPAYFNGAEPFGHAYGVMVYSKDKVDGPTIGFFEEMWDYVCVVLDSPIGNLTGWIGAKGYTDDWDGGDYWSHIGYPGDLTAGARPTFQNGISLDGKWYEVDSHEAIDHHADVWPGQSGGPFFGWWGNGPYAVAVQSAQNSDENIASGGQDLVDLILQARADYP